MHARVRVHVENAWPVSGGTPGLPGGGARHPSISGWEISRPWSVGPELSNICFFLLNSRIRNELIEILRIGNVPVRVQKRVCILRWACGSGQLFWKQFGESAEVHTPCPGAFLPRKLPSGNAGTSGQRYICMNVLCRTGYNSRKLKDRQVMEYTVGFESSEVGRFEIAE